MNIIMYLRDVAVCFFAAFFYGRFMSVPVKPLIPSSLSAAFSYLVYRIIFVESGHELIGFLSAALTVSFVSEILARIYKMPATIFVMPGIIPLVPGSVCTAPCSASSETISTAFSRPECGRCSSPASSPLRLRS